MHRAEQRTLPLNLRNWVTNGGSVRRTSHRDHRRAGETMKAMEIVCAGCDAHLRLSESLLARLAGRKGRVSCKQCENKVALDARGSELTVIAGGVLLPLGEGQSHHAAEHHAAAGDSITARDFSEAPPSGSAIRPPSPGLSSFRASIPSERAITAPPITAPPITAPPPLPTDLKLRRSRQQGGRALEGADSPSAAPTAPPRFDASSFEAPPPPAARGAEDSLSPQTLDEDEEGLVQLGGEFKSSPLNPSVRDLTYQSLYPPARSRRRGSPSHGMAPPSSLPKPPAPRPPEADQLRRSSAPAYNPLSDSLPEQIEGAVVVGVDGVPLNSVDLARSSTSASPALPERSPRSHAAPWLIALAACFALGISVATHPAASGWLGEQISRSRDSASASDLSQLSEAAAESSNAAVSEVAKAVRLESAVSPSPSESDAVAEKEAAVQEAAVQEAQSGSVRTLKPLAASSSRGTESTAEASVVKQGVATTQDATSSVEETSRTATVAPVSQPAEPAVMIPFSSSAASSALREATAKASGCRRPTDPSGQARISVTFAPSGRVTSATVSGPPFAGTPTGGCIASQFRSARVPEFTGEAVTVSRSVTIH